MGRRVAGGTHRSVAGLGAVLTLAMGIGPLLTTGFSALGPMITRELGLSRLEFGSIAVVACAAAALLSVPLGWISDRYSQRTGILLLHGFGLGGVLTASSAGSVFGLWAGAVLAGAALGLANPLTNSMVARRVEPGRRGMLVGVKQTGVQLTQMFTAVAYPLAAGLLSWRAGFLAGAVVVLLSLWAALRYIHVRPQCAAPRSASSPRQQRVAVKGFAWLVAYAFLSGILYQALAFYLPLFAFEQLAMRPEVAALCGVVLGATGLASRVLWGRLGERFAAPVIPLALIAVLSTVAVALVAGSSLWTSPVLLWAGTALYGLSGTASTVILLTVVMRLVPRAQAGGVTGRISIGIFGGLAAGPVLFGLLADNWDYTFGWLGLLAASLLMLLTLFGLHRLSVPGPAEAPEAVAAKTGQGRSSP